ECGVTILLIKHFVKGATAKAVHKVGGSAGYVNAVRAAYVLVPDKDDGDVKLLLPIKFNLGPKPSGLSFCLEALPGPEQQRILDTYAGHLDVEDREQLGRQLFRIRWTGAVEVDADDALAEQTKPGSATARIDAAAEWLQVKLAEGALPSLRCVEE